MGLVGACGSNEDARGGPCIGLATCADGTACTTRDRCEPVRGAAALAGFEAANSAVVYVTDGSLAVTIGNDLPCHPYFGAPADTLSVRASTDLLAGTEHALGDPALIAVQWNGIGSGGGQEWATAATIRFEAVGDTPGATTKGTLHVETASKAIDGTFVAYTCD
jgi:hypothetical protein